MFKRISPEGAHEHLDNQTAQFVDIRNDIDFEQGHIPKSLHLGQHNLQEFIQTADIDKPVIVTCYHGISSQSAAQILVEKGFEDVYSLDGGFEGWKQAYPDEIAQ
ncbi:MAG: thiosulfate sulfurtransferase GlpE [Cellvibrionales bacterium]|nr:thiosulfate sulfurtransferase GlpE [Cellvibrionales bacterium]